MSANDIELLKRLEAVASDQAARIRRISEIVTPLLERIYSIFPAYTDHGTSHSERVMTILGWLLPSNMKNPLSSYEMFYVLAAALLHDIGMSDAVDKVGDSEAQRRIRDSHHLRGAEYVRNNYERLELDKSEADAIGEICRSHRKINISKEINDIPDPKGLPIRMQLLCAAIRIADELHLTADRAPQIILDAIKPPQDSLSHFEKHLTINGVGPADLSDGVIQISATVQTLAQEKALRQMEDEIQEKLSEVEPLFVQHGLPWKKIHLELQRRKVVERKIVLYLAHFGAARRDELADNLGEPSGVIETGLRDLEQSHYVEPSDAVDKVQLVADDCTFKYWLRQFLDTDEEIQFVSSPYLQRCIEEFAFDRLGHRFGAFYDLQEREDRVLVIRSSPTALRLLLFVAELQVEQDIVPKRTILDMTIVLGFLIDAFRFPQVTQVRNIGVALMAIQSKIGQETRHQLTLLSARSSSVELGLQDVYQDILRLQGGKDAKTPDGVALSITVEHTRDASRRAMTFPHLLRASMLSGEPLELVPDKVQLTGDGLSESPSDGFTPDYLLIIPQRQTLQVPKGTAFCRLSIDYARKRVTLLADPARSGNYAKYPIAVRIVAQNVGRVTLSPSVYPANVDVQQALEINQMFRWFATGDFHRLVLELDQDGQVSVQMSRIVFQALGSDFEMSKVAPFIDDDFVQLLQHLARLQDRIGERIYLPIRHADEQEQEIIELACRSSDMEIGQIRDELKLIAAQAKTDYTSIRISIYSSDGQIDSDEFLGPLPRVVPQIELQQEEKNQEVREMVQKGEVSLRITQNSQYDVATLRQKIVDGFSIADKTTFALSEPESELLAKSCYQVTFYPVQDKLWYREQVVHYQIRDISGLVDISSSASAFLRQDCVEDAISELLNGLERYPDDSLLAGLLGWAYYRANDLDSAYKYSLEAVNPQGKLWSVNVSFAHYNLGLFSLLLGRFEEGMSWYERATKTGIGPVLDESIGDLEAIAKAELPEAFYALGFLYEHKKKPEQAEEWYERFLNSDSQYESFRESAQIAIRRLKYGDDNPDTRRS